MFQVEKHEASLLRGRFSFFTCMVLSPLDVKEGRMLHSYIESGPYGLHNLSLNVTEGEFRAVIGPSGSGKTTLLRALHGFVPIASGVVQVQGQDVIALPPSERGMAMVFQSNGLFDHKTGEQNIRLGLPSKQRRAVKVDDLVPKLVQMGLTPELLQRKPPTYSGGQRQRVGLLRALLAQAPVLLLDEPLSSVDAAQSESTRLLIRAVHDELRSATVLVTHNAEDVRQLADSVTVLIDGTDVQTGAVEEVYTKPLSLAVARLLGSVLIYAQNASHTYAVRSEQLVCGDQNVLFTGTVVRIGFSPVPGKMRATVAGPVGESCLIDVPTNQCVVGESYSWSANPAAVLCFPRGR